MIIKSFIQLIILCLICRQDGKPNLGFVGDDGLTGIDLSISKDGRKSYNFAYGGEEDRKVETVVSPEAMVRYHQEIITFQSFILICVQG